MSVKNRLSLFISTMNMSVRDFEKSINAANGYVNSISKSIGIDKINLIVEKYPTINIHWLMTGIGEMEFKDCTKSYNEIIDVDIAKEPSLYNHDLKYESLNKKYIKLLEDYNSLLRNKLNEAIELLKNKPK